MARPSQSPRRDAPQKKRGAVASFPPRDLELRFAVLDLMSSVLMGGRGRGTGTRIGLGAPPGCEYVRRCRVLCRECGDFGRVKDVPLANFIIVGPLHQIDMDMVLMIRICSVTEYRRKASARRLPQLFA